MSNLLHYFIHQGYSYMFQPLHMAIFKQYMLRKGHTQLKYNIIIGKW
jgi:hypothetical protein